MKNPHQTRNFLNCLFQPYFSKHEGFIEYRPIPPLKGGAIFCDTLREATSDGTFAHLIALNNSGYAIYVGVLPRIIKGGKEEDVKTITCLWADLDANDFKNGGKREALERLHAFEKMPSMLVDSGHGYHAYWLLNEATTDAQLARGIMKGMALKLNGDHTFDLSRILRLPGTINKKPDMPSVNCYLMDEYFSPELRYDIAQFKEYWTDANTNTCAAKLGEIPQDLPPRFREILIINKRLSDIWYGRCSMPHDGSRSGYDMALASWAKNLYFTEEEIATILQHSPSGKGRNASMQYLSKTIGNAKIW